jgi:hypothetical protein
MQIEKDSRSSSDRAVRNLVNLKTSAASWRTLNLVTVWEKEGNTEAYKAQPFFQSPVLNKAIIVKHRLRKGEHDLFYDDRKAATKVILPINLDDLRNGGRSFFIDQRGYDAILEDLAREGGAGQDDRDLLAALDELPSLDPFLTRERMRKLGRAPARCYFDITEADSARMFQFTRKEITPLIGMSFEQMDAGVNEKVSKLAIKILNNAGDAELEPLRQGMGLDKGAFEEGIFCWKGFIYYKWALVDLAPKIKPVSTEIVSIKPKGPATDEEKQYIYAARSRLSRAIAQTCGTVRDTLKIYDDAYSELTQSGQPLSFRDFLLNAPGLFHDLGEHVGGVQHIVSFWRFRFPSGTEGKITPSELCEIFNEFEHTLDFGNDHRAAA